MCACVVGLGRRSFSCFRRARPLLACRILFGETLLSGFALPVIVPNAPPVYDKSAAKLSEHGSSRDNCDLAGSV
jgi:hypothetical protein